MTAEELAAEIMELVDQEHGEEWGITPYDDHGQYHIVDCLDGSAFLVSVEEYEESPTYASI
jgi:hypothetical protein